MFKLSEKNAFYLAVVAIVISVLAIGLTFTSGGSEGPTGPVGPQGVTGAAGPAGPAGPEGADGSAASIGATYVTSEGCADCHEDEYTLFVNSGHKYKLNKVVDGQPPEYPYTEVLNPPEGYTWDDITYVIGGYNWKARFIGLDGYIITGDADATTQYNFPNEVLGTDEGWVAYHPGEQKPYDCGPCHTTGYKPEGNQDGLPGLIGTWEETGIACEECHGPGGNHIEDPYGVALKVDRTSEACGDCHYRGDKTVIDASSGFIKHHEQFEELIQTKHNSLTCVSCHDPHLGVIQGRQDDIDTTRVDCESCHFEEAKTQASVVMKSIVDCVDCHMPRIVKSAKGDATQWSGDIMSHLFAIDPTADSQFSEDGSSAISQITLDWACKSCHGSEGYASEYSDAVLLEEATDYHTG
jgi:hypothetical protein